MIVSVASNVITSPTMDRFSSSLASLGKHRTGKTCTNNEGNRRSYRSTLAQGPTAKPKMPQSALSWKLMPMSGCPGALLVVALAALCK
jgi:hypothetical protein